MGSKDNKKDFQDSMIQASMLKKGQKRETIFKAIEESDTRYDEDAEELKNLTEKQMKERENYKKKQD